MRAGVELPDLAPGARTNYHRWWNNPWAVVELGGQRKAGAWTPEGEARLRSLVQAAHEAGLWIRFYTLNGHDPRDESGGWSAGYNFGSEGAARERWRAAIRAGVDFIAVDQYERFSETLREMSPSPSEIVIKGELTHDDHERLFERPFNVPQGTARIQLGLSYTGGTEKTVIWLDVDRLQPYYEGLLPLHGRENTTYRGHANAIGERRFHEEHDLLPAGRTCAALMFLVRSEAGGRGELARGWLLRPRGRASRMKITGVNVQFRRRAAPGQRLDHDTVGFL